MDEVLLASIIRDTVAAEVRRQMPTVQSSLEAAIKALPAPQPGKDADPAIVRQMVEQAFDAYPKPQDGKSIEPAEVEQMVARQVAALPPPAPGKDAPPPDEKALAEDLLPKLAALAVSRAAEVAADLVGQIPPVVVDPLVVRAAVAEQLAAALADVPKPKDGEPGRDAAHLEILPAIDEAKSYPRGTFATHRGGLFRSFETTVGMKGWECIVKGLAAVDVTRSEDLRTFTHTLTLSDGSTVAKSFEQPVPIYRGIWEAQEYAAGDTATRDGCTWIALGATKATDQPGTSDLWRMSVKKGRDGRDGLKGDKGDPGRKGDPGHDLTLGVSAR